jgi:hypothetical protein
MLHRVIRCYPAELIIGHRWRAGQCLIAIDSMIYLHNPPIAARRIIAYGPNRQQLSGIGEDRRTHRGGFANTGDRFVSKVVMQPRVMATTSSRQNLDTINFFVAAVQTGFGPFIDVILTEHGWTETDIGFVLSVGTFAALASQSPAGALVDRFHDGRLLALLAIVAIVRVRPGSGISVGSKPSVASARPGTGAATWLNGSSSSRRPPTTPFASPRSWQPQDDSAWSMGNDPL